MSRRSLLTFSAAACLCGAYALYGAMISPLISPRADLLTERRAAAGDVLPKPAENQRQAEEHLREVAWAADAKYQMRTDQAFVYFEEWENLDEADELADADRERESGRVRFQPFAMIWRPQSSDRDRPPITIVCDSAVVEFARKFDVTNTSPGRVIGGALKGDVTVKGAEGLSLVGREFYFKERSHLVWSDSPVAFAYGPHSGEAQGLELDLIPEPGAPGDDKPAIAGVRTVRLRKDVVMNLVGRSQKEDKPDETVRVTSAGSFEYAVESDVATFQKKVLVVRPTGGGQFDRLSCDLLTLLFEPEKTADGTDDRPPESPRDDGGFGLTGGKLQFRRLRAEGSAVQVASQRSDMRGRMQELTYDAATRVVAFRDARQVRLSQRNNELQSPEVTVLLDEEGDVEQAVCRGAGKLFRYPRGAAPKAGARRPPPEFACEWLEELRMAPDTATGLDLIELTRRAVLNQPGRLALQADVVRLWVTPDKEGRGALDSNADADGDDERSRPRRMLALGSAAFASPQITGETERLEIWFEEGPLPAPPESGSGPPRGQRRVLRPERRAAPAPAASGAAAPADPGSAPAPRPPMHVVADLMQVRAFIDGDQTEVGEVITQTRVHVTQPRGAGEVPFDLQGDRLHLKNYSETHQVIRVQGQPAHIRDRGLQLEGADIHFDRAANQAQVEGGGVLRLPVSKGFDGRPLATPQLLDVFWSERMQFDGETSEFFGQVQTKLDGSEMRCEEMLVTLSQRIDFAQEGEQSSDADVRLVVCREGVELRSHEYEGNVMAQIRTARVFEFTLNQATGEVAALGPGTLSLWQRGGGGRSSLASSSGVRANRPLKTASTDWEYTRVDFDGRMSGDTRQQTTRFLDRVRVVHGPVVRSTDTIDVDELPRNGSWMRCDELELTQYRGKGREPDWIAVVGRGDVELEGLAEQGIFHAKAAQVSFDESKGLYTLYGDGKRPATLWREHHPGSSRDGFPSQRIEFIPSRDEFRAHEVSGAEGSG